MPRICYVDKNFRSESVAKIACANEIIKEYAGHDLTLTLRQLYYQFVARDWIDNTQREYKNLGGLVNDARLAGLIDWNAIVDRTRNMESRPTWEDPASIISACASSYGIDLWLGQVDRVEVWIEKDALVGVIERPCRELDVPWFSCRGYTSQSELWRAAQRHLAHEVDGSVVTVIHLGDHDPSGIDMTRDIQDRLHIFGAETTVKRVALTFAQVEQYGPPPNPTKLTDSRAPGYLAEYGEDSWELDALDPVMMQDLVRTEVRELMDEALWDDRETQQEEDRMTLEATSERWEEVEDLVS